MTHLVLIPAMACDAGLYAPLMAALPPAMTPHVIIARGETTALCVQQILHAAPETFILFGTSFGGRVALDVALAAPERLKGLILSGCSSKLGDPAIAEQRITRIQAGAFEAVITEMADMITYLPGPQGAAARQQFLDMAQATGPELLLAQNLARRGRRDVTADLPHITCPALMLWGNQDKFAAAQEGIAMASAMPQARFAGIESCGHLPTLEAEAESNGIVQHWLQDFRFV